ncbi:ArnT family glycosyltransferase [Skermania piniformis]|uniref:Glycosyltransferase family 39 protein n=1 Tax=Skermania pinensis TaxID=39122 RepID=A0ABX8SBN8_9ACTN|nr:glycosyltransferase family 39 protein [Skermania piniformis]QXQ15279.1 glycosyltransferase family 39 protein [Skermania piniformis]
MTALVATRPPARHAAAPPPPRRWARPDRWAPALLCAATAVLYLWGLSANGWANSFYAAAVQAGSQSWEAWFFGSSDAGNSITVDKPPASLWIPGLAARIFGMNSWSLLVPQALMGVASVGLLYLIVKRRHGLGAGLLAGSALALTPVAALMFRFDNPDALLVLLMIAAVWATDRALETGRLRWMVWTGVFVGFGFLTKQLQVMLVVPALAATYLAFGPRDVRVRIGHLFAAFGALIVSAGWWVALVQLWPKAGRPYIGGSDNNSIIELTFGYNGLGRLTGSEGGPGGGAPAGSAAMPDMANMPEMPRPSGGGMGTGFGGATGWGRLFDAGQGGQIAWLIIGAVILAGAALVLRGRAPRTDLRRAQLVLWLVWGVVTAAVFSMMSGIFHPYYTVALAPAVAACVGIGAAACWQHRERWWPRFALVAALAATVITAFVLLGRTPDHFPWLRYVIVVGAVVAGLGLLLPTGARMSVAAAVVALTVGLAGPAAFTLNTVAHARTGPIPMAGPQSSGERSPARPSAGGGPPGGAQASAQVLDLLRVDAGTYPWAAATMGSMAAAPYQLALGHSVMPIGGFSSGDPSPTLDQFRQYVAEGKIHYYIDGGMNGGPGGGTHIDLVNWVHDSFNSVTVDGVTIYDFTSPR